MPHLQLRRAARFAVLALVATIATCTDNPAGPGHGGRAYLAIEPTLSSSVDLAAFGLVIDSLRLVIVRPAADTLVDTTLFFDPDSSQIDFASPLTLDAAAETLHVSVVMSAGGVPVFSGAQDVEVTVGGPGVTPPATIPLSFTGPGTGITALHIAPADSVITLGDSLRFRVTADSSGVPITLFYVAWSTADTTRARINAFGRVRAPIHRDTITVFARTPTGVRDSTVVTFVPVPTSLVTAGGAGQTGPVGGPLAVPLRARVTAGDGLGVKGVAVQFSVVSGGGSIAAAPVATDSGGYAQTTATLGTTIGGNVFRASAAGLTAVTFSATATAATPTQLLVSAGDGQTHTAGGLVTVAPAVLIEDTFNNPVAGVIVTFAVASGGGSVTQATDTTNASGIATVGGWTLGTLAGGNALTATAGVLSHTFTATGVPGPASVVTSLITASSDTLASGSVATLSLRARDAFNNNLTAGGLTVAFSIAGGTSTGTLSAVTDSGNGVYTARFTGLTAGTVDTVHATIGGTQVTSAAPLLRVVPGAVSLATSLVTTDSATLASGDSTLVHLFAKDANGNALTTGGLTVVFSAVGGGSTGTFFGLTDHLDGTYSASFKALLAGAATSIHATIGGSPVTSAAPALTVLPGAISAATSTVTTSAATLLSGASVTLTLRAKDAVGNALTVGGATVTFSNSGGSTTGTISGTTDNGNGTYTATFTGVLAGTATTIHATIGATPVTSVLPNVTVSPGAISAATSVVSVASGTIGSGAGTTLTLQAKDAAGNNLTAGGATVAFSFSGGTSTGTISAITDNGNGTYTATFTGIVAGTGTSIGATINATAVTTALPTITVAAGAASAATSVVTVSSGTVASGVTATVTLRAKDAAGNSLTLGGASVAFSASGGSSTGTFGTVTDNSDGTYTATFTGGIAGTAATINATLNGTAVTTVLPTVTVTPGAISAATSVITVGSGTILSGAGTLVTLRAKDAAGNNLSAGGATVLFSNSGGTSTGTFAVTTDNANGTYTTTFAGALAGTATTIGATINAAAVTTALPTVTVAPGAVSLATSTLTTSSGTLASGAAATLTLQAKDAAGNNLTAGGLTITFVFAGGTSTGTISATTDNANGTYTATFTGVTAGSATTVGAKLGASPFSATTALTVVPGNAVTAQSIVSVSAGTVLSGGGVTLTLQEKDANGNNITVGGDVVVFTRSGGTSTGTIGATTDNANGTYTATFTALAAGTPTTIGATINGSAVTSTLPTVTVSAGAISAATSVITIGSGTILSGAGTLVTLQAKDAAGNNLSAGGATVLFSNSGGTSTGTFAVTTDNGNGTYTTTFAGVLAGTATTIGATINATAVTTALPTIVVTPGGASLVNSVVSVGTASILSGGSTSLTLQAKDAAGNNLTASAGTVVFSFSGGTATGNIAPSPATDNGNGTYTATFTGALAGTTTIGATINGSAVTSVLPTITVASGAISAAASVVTVAAPTIASGLLDTLTLQAKDAAGNSVTTGGATVVFSNSGGTSTGVISATTDHGNGLYTATFLGGVAGTATTIGATVGGTPLGTTSPTITVTPGAITTVDVTPGTATLTALGNTQQFSAVAHDLAGNTVPTSFTWTVLDTLVAFVTPTGGLATALRNGPTSVHATAVGGVFGSATLTVAQLVTQVQVLPAADTLHAINNSRAFTAVAKDASDSVVAGQAFTWTSADTLIAKINGSGVALAVGAGTDTITATTGSVSGKATLVVAQVVASVTVAPDTVTLSVGVGQQFSATAKDSNGFSIAAATFTWGSTNPLIGSVNTTGLAVAVGVGVDTITATAAAVVGRAELRVINTVHTADIFADSVWTAAKSPHVVRGYLKIANGATLTIQPGAVVKFDTASGLQVGDSLALGGGLVLDGTTLTADSTVVRPGYWRGIEIQQAIGPLQLRHFTLEGGGGLPAPFGLRSALLVRATGADIRIDSATIQLSGGHGIAVYGAKPSALRITRSTVTGSQASGMVVLAPLAATDSLAANSITGNGAYPLAATAGALPGLYPSVYAGNSRDTLLLAGGTLVGSGALAAVPGVPWRVTAPVNVDSGGALRVTDAQTVFFDSTAGIVVGDSTAGTFDVLPNGPTTFTVTPGQGSWLGIQFSNLVKDDTLRQLIVDRGGMAKCSTGVIIGGFAPQRAAPLRAPARARGATPVLQRDVIVGCEFPTVLGAVQYDNVSPANVLLDSVTVRGGPGYAIGVARSGLGHIAVTHGQFYNNAYAPVFRTNDGAALTIDSSDIYHYGRTYADWVIQNDFTSNPVLAQHNWWGDVAGPGSIPSSRYLYSYADSIGRAILIQQYDTVDFASYATQPFFPVGSAATVIATPDSVVPDVFAGLPLPDSIRGRVVDPAGRGVVGTTVAWGTASGSGSVGFLTDVSDSGGRVGGVWTPSTVAKLDTAFVGLGGPSARYYLNVIPAFATTVNFELDGARTQGPVAADSNSVTFTSTGRHGVIITNARDAYGNVPTPSSYFYFDNVPGSGSPQPYGTIDSTKGDSVFFTVSNAYPATFQIHASYPTGTTPIADSVIVNMNQIGTAVQIWGYGFAPTDSVTFNSLCPSSGPFNFFCQRTTYAYVVDSAGAPLQSNPGYIPFWHPLIPGDTTVGIAPAYVNNFGPPVNAQMNGSTAIVVDIVAGPALAVSSDTVFITVQQAMGRLDVSPDTVALGLGDTTRFQAAVADSGGTPLATQPAVQWQIDPVFTGLVKLDSTANSLLVRFDSGVYNFSSSDWIGVARPFIERAPGDTLFTFTAAGQGTIHNPIHYDKASGVSGSPQRAAVDTVSNRVFVTNFSGVVTVIDATDNSLKATTAVGALPIWLAVNHATNGVFVANNGGQSVSVLDGTSASVVTTIPLPQAGGTPFPAGVASDEGNKRIYVAVNYGGAVPTLIVPIDATTNSIITADTFRVSQAASTNGEGLAFNRANGLLYLGTNDGNVQVLDPSAHSTTTIGLSTCTITDVAVNAVTDSIYAADFCGELWVIDGATNAMVNAQPANTPQGVSVDETRNKIFFGSAGNNTVTVLDGATENRPYVIVGNSGDFPQAAAVDPRTGTVYAPHATALTILQFYGPGLGVALPAPPIRTAQRPLSNLAPAVTGSTPMRTAGRPLAAPALPRAKTTAKAKQPLLPHR